MEIAKNIFKKAKQDKQDVYQGLLTYRSTPGDDIPSPGQLLMGRRLKSNLPTHSDLLKPNLVNTKLVVDKLKQRQVVHKELYDKNAKDLKPLKDYSNARVQSQKGTWKPCVVTGATETPRSYKIVTDDGGEYIRNRRFLRSVPTTPQKKPLPESPSPKTQSY